MFERVEGDNASQTLRIENCEKLFQFLILLRPFESSLNLFFYEEICDLALNKLTENGVQTDLIATDRENPTSVIFVSKTTGTPDFIPYRYADTKISEAQVPDALLAQTTIFHTTAFALSKKPARTTILAKAKKAYENVLISTVASKYDYDTYIINDTFKELKDTLQLKIIDFYGKEIWSNSKVITIQPNSSEKIYHIPQVDIYKAGYVYLIEFGTSKSTYFFDKPKNLALPKGEIQQKIKNA